MVIERGELCLDQEWRKPSKGMSVCGWLAFLNERTWNWNKIRMQYKLLHDRNTRSKSLVYNFSKKIEKKQSKEITQERKEENKVDVISAIGSHHVRKRSNSRAFTHLMHTQAHDCQ